MFQHPELTRALAREHRRDLYETADHRRLAKIAGRRAKSPERPAPWQPVLIRPSSESDASALARLADLDSRTLPAGRFLVAEVDGELAVAVPLDVDAAPLADPFRPTENLKRSLERQAQDLRITDRAQSRRTRLELRRAA
jgi:hypothetical protein